MSAKKSLWNFPKIIAHRGCGTFYPENTIEGISMGYSKYGYRAIEFDVMLTRDNVPILMHDYNLGRTVKLASKWYSCILDVFKARRVSDYEWNEVKNWDVGSWFAEKEEFKNLNEAERAILASIRPPLFEDVIKLCKEKGIWMNIEIKPVPGFENISGQVVAEMVSKYFPPVGGAGGVGEAGANLSSTEDTRLLQVQAIALSDSVPPPCFSSFSRAALVAAKKHAPHIDRALLIKTLTLSPDWKEQLDDVEAVSLNLHHMFLKESNFNEIKAYKHKDSGRGVAIFCYTVNEVSRGKALFEMGVDSFCTDKVDLFSYIPL
jgi:glycerophosphoryl diester phosphodiesterase